MLAKITNLDFLEELSCQQNKEQIDKHQQQK